MRKLKKYKKIFSVREARTLVPDLRPRLLRMREIREHLDRYRDEAEQTSRDVDRGGSTMPSAADYFPLVGEITSHLKYFQAIGVLIKDLSAGLVDFPSIRDGRVVFLCWHAGEETVSHWHEVDAGIADRNQIEQSEG
ncbi:MAG: DUF2203 domain-containing protein [Nitrospinota bacterium]|jgi:hypothetical protein|nr:DUF2203 domain-containing protein [Nitrospinota bacterium]